MKAPVEAVSGDATVRAAHRKMHQLQIDCLVVLDEHRIVGVVARSDVDKAMEHKLGRQRLRAFMSAPAITVRPRTPFFKIRQLMVENDVGHLPVVGSNGLVGMISRSDVLKAQSSHKDWGFVEGALRPQAENLSGLMRQQLSPGVQRILREVGRLGKTMGWDVFLVGGSVRDLLLRVPDVDLDIVVTGDGIAFARKFVSQHGGRVVCYRRFATALMVLPGGVKIDVVSARWERYKRPGALPSIESGALLQDLYRRDFTINSMAIQLSGGHYGKLVDPFGGRRDLARKTIRVMHNLSFVEDPTRMIRAVRFEGRYGFRMDRRTQHLLIHAARAGMLDKISGQRLREEILILLREKRPLPAIRQLDRLEVLTSLSPELKVTSELSGLLKRTYLHLQRWGARWARASVDSWMVHLVGLFSVLSPEERDKLADRLSLHRKARQCLQQACRAEGEVLSSLETERRPPNSELYRLLHPFMPEVLIYLMARSKSRSVGRRILHYWGRLREVTLEIGGEDLKAMGLAQGAIYNRILDQVLMAKLDRQLQGRSQELNLAAKLAEAES